MRRIEPRTGIRRRGSPIGLPALQFSAEGPLRNPEMNESVRREEPREEAAREREREEKLPYEPPQVQSVKLSTEAAEALT